MWCWWIKLLRKGGGLSSSCTLKSILWIHLCYHHWGVSVHNEKHVFKCLRNSDSEFNVPTNKFRMKAFILYSQVSSKMWFRHFKARHFLAAWSFICLCFRSPKKYSSSTSMVFNKVVRIKRQWSIWNTVGSPKSYFKCLTQSSSATTKRVITWKVRFRDESLSEQ